MPAYMSHYICGLKAFHTLAPGELRECIRSHAGIYDLGLAGPDIFFYSLKETFFGGMRTGRLLHKNRSGAFLMSLIRHADSLEGEERRAALAYAAGFIGHYSLDSACHPLVFRVCHDSNGRRALGRHYRFEGAADAYFCEYYLRRNIRNSHQMGLLKLSRPEKHAAAAVLAASLQDVFGDEKGLPCRKAIRRVLTEYYLVTGFLIDDSGFRDWAVSRIEILKQGYPLYSGLFINDNRYGAGKDLLERFRARFERGVRRNARLLAAMDRYLSSGEIPEERIERLSTALGNLSYHTGKPLMGNMAGN